MHPKSLISPMLPIPETQRKNQNHAHIDERRELNLNLPEAVRISSEPRFFPRISTRIPRPRPFSEPHFDMAATTLSAHLTLTLSLLPSRSTSSLHSTPSAALQNLTSAFGFQSLGRISISIPWSVAISVMYFVFEPFDWKNVRIGSLGEEEGIPMVKQGP